MTRVADVLQALADLAPGDATPDDIVDVTGGDQTFLWLGLETGAHGLFTTDLQVDAPLVSATPAAVIERTAASKRLHAYDALHREERLLRMGYVFLCGRVEIGGRPRRICMPLVVRPVRLHGAPVGSFAAEAMGDVLTLGGWRGEPPTPDSGYGPPSDAQLLDRFHHLRQWVDQVVAGAGYPPISALFGPDVRPEDAKRRDDLVAVLGYGLYVDQAAVPVTRGSTLRDWAEVEGIEDTAFSHVYGLAPSRPPLDEPGPASVPQPLALTAAQGEVVARASTAEVTVASGAPGNGKSHAVCALAIDAVARGRSVLLVTPTPYAADVLGELLDRQPGPDPILFGETEGRRRMIHALESLAERTVGEEELGRRRAAVVEAAGRRAAAERAVFGALEREVRADRVARWTARLPELRAAAPNVFLPGSDLAEVRRRVASVRADPTWWRRRRLRKLVGCAPIVGVDAVADAVEACADVRAELELDIVGGTAIGAAWDELLAAEAFEAAAEGELIDGLVRDESRWDEPGWLDARGRGRRAVGALLRALPAGRATRRDLLADIDAEALVRALPLWVGTLRDVDDLLPRRPGLFDLVIVDEAVQVDQFRAAGALLRAERAVIVGDPRQLRHVSFVADADVSSALEHHGADALADRLDVRRQSIYDVAAGAAPVTFLDEHFRSVPHLIAFSARRFYDDRIHIATRNPRNESTDAIDVVRVADVPGEVTAAVDLVARLVAEGRTSIGVLSPFRAQVDAIEAAILDRFEPEVIERHGVRTGTAHSAQGSERDTVVIALGLAVDDDRARWRFVEDPNLFNVLITRGRSSITVVTALPPEGLPRGIVADYLRHAEEPPAPPVEQPSPDPWVSGLAAELERNGVNARERYPVGRWEVDICAGAGPSAVALDCSVHPDGPAAHIARHRSLRRAGWTILDAYRTRWDGDPAIAAIELRDALATGFRPSPPAP